MEKPDEILKNILNNKRNGKFPSHLLKYAKKAIFKALGWIVMVLLFSLIPIFLSSLVAALDPDVSFEVVELIKNGAIILIGVTLTGSAWLDFIQAKVGSRFFTTISNVMFVGILLISTVVITAVFSLTKIDYSVLYYFTITIFVFSSVYAFGVKALLNFYEVIRELLMKVYEDRLNETEDIDYVEVDEIKQISQEIYKNSAEDRLELERLKEEVNDLKSTVKDSSHGDRLILKKLSKQIEKIEAKLNNESNGK